MVSLLFGYLYDMYESYNNLCYIMSDYLGCDQCVLLKESGCKYSRTQKALCWTRIW